MASTAEWDKSYTVRQAGRTSPKHFFLHQISTLTLSDIPIHNILYKVLS